MKLDLVIVPRLASALIRLLYASLRVRSTGVKHVEALEAKRQNFILAFWHGHLLLMVKARFTYPMTVLISQHRDGELIARTMQRFGADIARGSSTRGGAAGLRDLVRGAERGNLAITPDGPRGPRRIAQGGAITAARLTGLPILPVALVAKKKRCCVRGIASRFPSRSAGLCSSTGSPLKSRAA